MSSQHDDDLPERDARFDAAWRGVSNEEPPAALDAAIRAAAHREAGTGPRRVERAAREAPRSRRWWLPLATAATVGATALVLLQMGGPGRPFGSGPATVTSDAPPGTTAAKREAPSPLPAPPSSASAPAPAAGRARAPAAAARYESAKEARRGDPPTARPESSRADSAESVSPGKAAARREGAPPMVAAPEPSFAEPAAPAAAARAAAVEGRRAGIARDLREVPAPHPVAEWIDLIRKLRDEGKTEEAASELAAFRRTHPDHELLLPPDLVRWRADPR